jgi:hypothetical protein
MKIVKNIFIAALRSCIRFSGEKAADFQVE